MNVPTGTAKTHKKDTPNEFSTHFARYQGIKHYISDSRSNSGRSGDSTVGWVRNDLTNCYKIVFMLNSAEHEICPANKSQKYMY